MKTKITTMDAIERVFNCTEKSELNHQKFEACNEELMLLLNYFNLSQEETVFAVIVFCFELVDDTCNLNEIRNFLNLNEFKFLPYQRQIQNIVDKGLVEKKFMNHYSRRMSKFEYRINPIIFECIVDNTPIPTNFFTPIKEEIEWLEMMANFIENDLESIEPREIDEHYKKLCKRFENGKLHNSFNQLGVTVNHSIILTHVIWSNYLGESFVTVDDVVNKLYNSRLNQIRELRAIKEDNHVLCNKDLLEGRPGKFMNGAEVRVTESFRLKLKEMGISIEMHETNHTSCIKFASVASKPLFFTHKSRQQLLKIDDILKEQNYQKIQKRMLDKGMKPGITALFFGKPGTGKTESVLQYAKKYKRDIIHVDISETKSMWFGQSEKMIKRIFTRYKEVLEDSKITPILLLNEADAILGKRKTGGKSNVENTENAIQNILLEEMENFEGILIATTNLAVNLDAAFDRRFLFKVEFETPDAEQRYKIWQTKLPKYGKNNLKSVANDYELSGGQIDNIIRKMEIDYILNGVYPNKESLIELCENELILNRKQYSKIGFN
jgi:hypothetical protein